MSVQKGTLPVFLRSQIDNNRNSFLIKGFNLDTLCLLYFNLNTSNNLVFIQNCKFDLTYTAYYNDQPQKLFNSLYILVVKKSSSCFYDTNN